MTGPGGAKAEWITGWRRMLLALSGVVAVDQLTKGIAVAALERGEQFELGFGLELTNVRNRGIAFGLFADGQDVVMAVTAAALALILVYFAVNAASAGLWLGVGLIGGGALGNMADRVRIEAVVDFIDPPLWPAFNVADIAIVSGVLVLLWVAEEAARDRRAPPQPVPRPPQAADERSQRKASRQ